MPEFVSSSVLWYGIFILAIVIFAIFVIRGYIKRLSNGCCGSGGDRKKVKKVKVGDRDPSHYPFAVVLTIDGMVCQNCAQRIENTLNGLDGVWADADAYTKKVLVRMKEPMNKQLLRDTVNHIGGYTVMKVEEKSAT